MEFELLLTVTRPEVEISANKNISWPFPVLPSVGDHLCISHEEEDTLDLMVSEILWMLNPARLSIIAKYLSVHPDPERVERLLEAHGFAVDVFRTLGGWSVETGGETK